MKKNPIRIKECDCGGDIYELNTQLGTMYQCKSCGEMYR